jgi:hypothetical protein
MHLAWRELTLRRALSPLHATLRRETMMAMPHDHRDLHGEDAHAWIDEDAAMEDADRFNRAQQQALEMLFHQCVDEIYAGEITTLASSSPTAAENAGIVVTNDEAASFMDFLAQACEEANDHLQDISPQDVAKKLAEVVAATQQSLRDVQTSVTGLMQDPEKMKALCQQFDEADEQIKQLKLAHEVEHALLMGEEPPSRQKQAAPPPPKEQQLAVATNEESLRNMMLFADNMCGVLDNALSTISKDEYELAAQLSLGIAQKLLEAGQSLFMSIGDDIAEKGSIGKGDRSDRITIEELADDDIAPNADKADAPPKQEKRESIAAKRLRQKRAQRQQATAVRNYVLRLADQAQERASANPVAAAAIGMFTLPFIGLAVRCFFNQPVEGDTEPTLMTYLPVQIPIASMVGLALVLEKYYPEHTSLTLEMFGNFVQVHLVCLALWSGFSDTHNSIPL